MSGDQKATEEQAFEEMSHEECLAVLAGHSFGRLAVVDDGQPDIFPVNYALDGERVVFRSGPGSKLDHASLDRVAFEIDEIDEERGIARSVVVKGTAREFTGAIDVISERERDLDVPAWLHPDEPHLVRIVPRRITGRRVRRPAPPA